MINDVDTAVAEWLRSVLRDVVVAAEAPQRQTDPGGTEKGTGSRSRSARAPDARLSLFLHDVREDEASAAGDWESLRGEDGVVFGRVPPTRRYRLTYLLVAQAADSAVEHGILGRVLAATTMHQCVPEEFLPDGLAPAVGEVLVRCAPATRSADPSELWSGWGVVPRTTLELSVLAPLLPSYVAEVSSPPSRIQLGVRHSETPVLDRPGDRMGTPTGPVGRISED